MRPSSSQRRLRTFPDVSSGAAACPYFTGYGSPGSRVQSPWSVPIQRRRSWSSTRLTTARTACSPVVGSCLASGVARLPFDGGESLVSGGKGAFFSVPELFFVNIRKGSLEYARSEEPRTRLSLSER